MTHINSLLKLLQRSVGLK